MRQAAYNKRREAGLCVDCNAPSGKYASCDKCREDRAATNYFNTRYAKLRARGICVQCGFRRTKRTRCLKCRAKRWKQYKLTMEERINESLDRRIAVRDSRIEKMLALVETIDRLKKRLEDSLMVAWEEIEKTPNDAVEIALAYLEVGREAFGPRKRSNSSQRAYYVELGILICLFSAGGMVWVIGKMFGAW